MSTKLKAKDPQTAVPSKPKILAFGKSGVGKTWASLDWPNVFYIDTEGGANLPHYVAKLSAVKAGYFGPEDGALDFAAVCEQIKALGTEKHRYSTLVVDSFSKLYNTAIADEAERLGSKDAFGASKKPAIALTRRMIALINKLDMNVVLIAHSRSEWGTDGKTGERIEIGQTFDGFDKLEYELNLCLEISKNGPKRLARIRKSRYEQFVEGTSFDWSFHDFANKFGSEVINGEVHVVTLARADQVTEIERLVSVVKLEEGTVEKWLSKAEADTLADLSEDQAAAIITMLNKKLNPPTK